MANLNQDNKKIEAHCKKCPHRGDCPLLQFSAQTRKSVCTFLIHVDPEYARLVQEQKNRIERMIEAKQVEDEVREQEMIEAMCKKCYEKPELDPELFKWYKTDFN